MPLLILLRQVPCSVIFCRKVWLKASQIIWVLVSDLGFEERHLLHSDAHYYLTVNIQALGNLQRGGSFPRDVILHDASS